MNGVAPGVVLFRGTSLLSKAIRWQTRSVYSHAALLCPDGHLIHALADRGVVREPAPFGPDDTCDVFNVPSMTSKQWEAAARFAAAQVGKGYDWWGVIRFVARDRLPDSPNYFCSELVFEALAWAGRRVLERCEAYDVSPGMLGLSPCLCLRHFSPLRGLT